MLVVEVLRFAHIPKTVLVIFSPSVSHELFFPRNLQKDSCIFADEVVINDTVGTGGRRRQAEFFQIDLAFTHLVVVHDTNIVIHVFEGIPLMTPSI